MIASVEITNDRSSGSIALKGKRSAEHKQMV
jgi:hypothetical protein